MNLLLCSLSVAVLSLMSPHRSVAIPVDVLFGNQDPVYIKSYHKRQYAWQNENVFPFTKCLPPKLAPLITEIIENTSTWGLRLGQSGDLVHAVEYSYKKEKPESALIYGMRVAIPESHKASVQKALGSEKTDKILWGLQVSSTSENSCVVSPVFLESEEPFSLLESTGGKSYRLTYSKQRKPAQKKYPFQPVIISAIPLSETQEILSLSSFNLVFLSSEMIPLALMHEKQFHQLTLRLIWNSTDDYTVFYP